MTTKIEIYGQGLLPESLTWQSLSFMRCEWPWLFTGEGRLRAAPLPASTHLACTDGQVLLSYAEIVDSTAVRAGRQIQVAGLSNVFTFPPYRNEGLASEMIRVAHLLIDERQPEMAILFCKDDLVPFYAALGWIDAPAGAIVSALEVPRAMVRRPGTDGPDLIGELMRTPVTVATAW